MKSWSRDDTDQARNLALKVKKRQCSLNLAAQKLFVSIEAERTIEACERKILRLLRQLKEEGAKKSRAKETK